MTQKTNWWKNAVVYQIYPRSFQDSDGDGMGDLKGIISRLDYLQKLGIDAIWLSPVCKSPQDDNGYDISDYRDIDPLFGTLADMEELIAEAKKRNIRILLDLVLNHSSDEHYWFKEALKGKDNPYHDYYVWRDGKAGELPNDMKACFGGSCWEWVPELSQYYFHQFSVKQPDLNWENPRLRQEIYDMINWWIDKGVGGFRLDVIDQIAKEPDLKITNNGPRLHEYIRELSKNTFQRADLITVGEAWGADTERAKLYSAPDGSEFSMVFQFEHICLDQIPGKEKWDLAPFDLVKFKKVMEKWQHELNGCGWNSLFWNNHDLPRIVSRWGNDKEYRIESAKMLAIVLHGMQGTPYIYQGEELGMTNAWEFTMDEYRDLETLNLYRDRKAAGYSEEDIMNSLHAKSRDNARTPMHWDASENAGFTTGKSWIPMNPNYVEINVAQELSDPNSVFYTYQKLIALRKAHEVFIDGDFELLYAEDPDLVVYTRKNASEKLVVVANFHGAVADMPAVEGVCGSGVVRGDNVELLCSSYADTDENAAVLRPYEAKMYRLH
ncbi:MAG: alpha-glucosidase [Lachnospiraceae bacterium]|nr:alpha-glucosidase [Lachnospiraceae bacterium]